jgi:predicted transcriptional regulator
MTREEVIKNLIDENGLTLKAFAAKAGIPYTTLRSMLERGIGNASVDNVLKICKALDITFEQLEQLADNKDHINTIAAHNDNKEFSEEELQEIERFKAFIKMRREQMKK